MMHRLRNTLNAKTLSHRGYFTGDFNATTIEPGIYSVSTMLDNAPDQSKLSQWYTFIQFEPYRTQLCISYRGMAARAYIGNPEAWDPWVYYDHS